MSGEIQTKAEAKVAMLQRIECGFAILTEEPMFEGVPTTGDMPEGQENAAGNMEFSIPQDWGVARYGGPNNMRIVNGDDIGETLCRWCSLIAAPSIYFWLEIDPEVQKASIEAW